MSSQCADVIQAIVSVINLAIVVLFFVWDKKSALSINRNERKEYWYHETLINRGIQAVEFCFDDLENIINVIDVLQKKNEMTEELAKENIIRIGAAISTLKRKLDAYSQLFDSLLARKIRNVLNELEDYLTEGTEKIYKSELVDDLLFKLSTSKYQVLKILYEYDVANTKKSEK